MPKTLVYPAGGPDDAVSQYRLRMPCDALKSQGADVDIAPWPSFLWNREWHGPHPPPDARILGIDGEIDAETVVIQRPAMRWWAEAIPIMQKAGHRVVVDVDDDFEAIPQGHGAHEAYETVQGWHSKDWIVQACKNADLVTCSTQSLLKRYGFGHGVVIPNFVPGRYLKIEPIFTRVQTIGWTGKLDSHPFDLQVTRGAVGDLCRELGWAFHILGNPEGVRAALELREEPSAMSWVPFVEYPGRMAEVEVGIVPLEDSRFNDAKSALKLMEYAALGVPVLASATPDNIRMADQGIGIIVKRSHHWRKRLKTLLENPEYRKELAGTGRERMAEFTYEKECWRWGFAWHLDADKIHDLAEKAS